MQYWSELLCGLAVLNYASSHMYVTHPPPRASQEFKDMFKLDWRFEPDYDIAAPLGKAIPNLKYRPYPCIGHKQYKYYSSARYEAGKLADIKIGGTVHHNGGHCQMSISYDEETFVAIGNMYNDCAAPGNETYKIRIPASAPSGHAVLGWTWISRTGDDPEFYMNCVDVTIEGKENGYIEGHEVLIRQIDAKLGTNFTVGNRVTAPFQHWFPKDYGINFFSTTPKYRISPGRKESINTVVKTEVYISEGEKKKLNPGYNPETDNLIQPMDIPNPVHDPIKKNEVEISSRFSDNISQAKKYSKCVRKSTIN